MGKRLCSPCFCYASAFLGPRPASFLFINQMSQEAGEVFAPAVDRNLYSFGSEREVSPLKPLDLAQHLFAKLQNLNGVQSQGPRVTYYGAATADLIQRYFREVFA